MEYCRRDLWADYSSLRYDWKPLPHYWRHPSLHLYGLLCKHMKVLWRGHWAHCALLILKIHLVSC